MIHLLVAALLLPGPGAPAGVRLSRAVVPETVTVGDRFRSAVRLAVPPGSRVRFPALATGDSLQQVGGTRASADRSGATAVYPLVAWIAGGRPARELAVEVIVPSGDTLRYRIPVPLPFVRSVLPTDTAGLRPKPGRPPLPLSRPAERYRLVLLAIALVAALGTLYWLWRRRGAVQSPRPGPRERALGALDALREERLEPLLQRGGAAAEYSALYADGLGVLREFVAALRPEWGLDLTGRELAGRMAGAAVDPACARTLAELAEHAEPVEFAGASPAPGQPERFWSALRRWIASADLAGPAADREAA